MHAWCPVQAESLALMNLLSRRCKIKRSVSRCSVRWCLDGWLDTDRQHQGITCLSVKTGIHKAWTIMRLDIHMGHGFNIRTTA